MNQGRLKRFTAIITIFCYVISFFPYSTFASLDITSPEQSLISGEVNLISGEVNFFSEEAQILQSEEIVQAQDIARITNVSQLAAYAYQGDIDITQNENGEVVQATMQKDFIFEQNGGFQARLNKDTEISTKSGAPFDALALGLTETELETIQEMDIENIKGSVEFGIPGQHLIFSKLVQIDIPTNGIQDGEQVQIFVEHAGEAINTSGITTNPNASCEAGISSDESNTVSVLDNTATFYTCGASTFTASQTYVSGSQCIGADYSFDINFTDTDNVGSYDVYDQTNSSILATGTVTPINVIKTNNTSTTPFDIVVRDGTDSSSISEVVSVNPLDCSSVTGKDTDGDGVADESDLDDDNDGILDRIEGERIPGEIFTQITGGSASIVPNGNNITANLSENAWTSALMGDDISNITSATDYTLEYIFTGYDHTKTLHFMGGLSDGAAASDTNPNYNGTDYAILVRDTSTSSSSLELRLYEDGTFKGAFGTPAVGDIFGIKKTGTLVEYQRNGVTFYTSSKAASSSDYHIDMAFKNGIDLVISELNIVVDIEDSDFDSDNDGIPNYKDLDSDNDGIPDNVEFQTTAGYIAPGVFTDTNGDGVNDVYASGVLPVNTDNTDREDYIDADSDNDGTNDSAESGLTLTGTYGNNGLDKGVETSDDYSDVNGNINSPANLKDTDGDSEMDYRDTVLDVSYTQSTTTLTVGENTGTGSYTIVLNVQPTSDVVIDLVSSDTSEGTVSPASLTFTSANWDTPQTVSVTGVDDSALTTDTATITASVNAASSSDEYDGLADKSVAVTFTNDDSAGFTQSTGSLDVGESSGSGTYTIVLDAQPLSDVVIDLVSSDTAEGTVSPASLTFTSANWDTPQTIKVTGVDDSVIATDTATITASIDQASSSDEYDGLADKSVAVTFTNDDRPPVESLAYTPSAPGITFHTGTSLSKINDGDISTGVNASGDYQVHPTNAIGKTITMTFAEPVYINSGKFYNRTRCCSDRIGGSQMIFKDASGTVVYTYTFPTTGNPNVTTIADPSGPIYNIKTVELTSFAENNQNFREITFDGGTPKLIQSSTGSTIGENGGTETYTIKLNSEPLNGNVVVDLSSSNTAEGTVSPASLTFTPSNWYNAQTVTVTGVDDNVISTDAATITASINTASSSDEYDAVTSKTYNATFTNDDSVGITLSSTGSTIGENSGTGSFSVVLDTQPSSNVVIDIISNNTSEATVSPATITFTPANWNVNQIATVTAVNDDIDRDDSTTLTISIDDTNSDDTYDSVADATLPITITDDDSAGFTQSTTSLTISENGGTGTYTLVLDSQPISDVVIDLTSSDTSEGTVSPASLTFTSANWDTTQIVTVTGIDDSAVATDTATITASIDASSSSDEYDGLADKSVAVTFTNDDANTPSSAPDLQIASDTGTSSTDNLTSDTTPSFDVQCFGSGNTITLYSDSPTANTSIGTYTCTGIGNETATSNTALSNGTHNISYTNTESGNISAHSPSLSIIIDATSPVITVTGANPASVVKGATYTDAGATCSDNYDATCSTTSTGTVDTSTIGTYTMTYNVTDASGNTSTATRTVNVIAGDIPVISRTGSGSITQEVGGTYTDAGATANDPEDGDISADIVTTNPVDTTTVGTYTIKYNVTDSSGNAAVEVTRTVNIVDTTAPVITRTGSGTITQEVDSTYTDAGATCSDNYDATCSTTSTGSVDTTTVGTYTIKYNVTDSSGNDAVEVTRTVNIVDTTAPVITVTGANPASVVKGATYTDAGATCSDNYDATCSTTSTGSVDTSTTGTYTIKYNVTDSSGNAAVEVTRTVNIVDTTAPVITRTGSGTITQEVNSTYTDAGATCSDNYDATCSTTSTGSVDTSTTGTYTITYSATDNEGNTSTATRTVNVVAGDIPVITRTGSGTITQEVNSTYTDAGATCSDNYDATCSTTSTGSVDTTRVGTYTIKYNVTDSSGNDAVEVTRTVNIVDTTAPVITRTGSGTITQEVDSTYTDAGATCSDNYDATCSTTSTGSVDTSTIGTYTIKYNVTDSSGNDAVEVTRTVNIVDTTSPVITVTGNNPETVNKNDTYTDAGATCSDNYDATCSTTSTGSVDTSTTGTYTITYSATDNEGNTSTATRTVNVVAGDIPVITRTGSGSITQEVGGTYTDAGATASDTEDGNISADIVTTNPVNANVVGTYMVRYNVTDASGNAAVEVTRTVNIVDTTSPVITVTGNNPETVNKNDTYTDAGATCSDNYDATCSTTSTGTVNTGTTGTYTITYSATDNEGNTSTATRTVNVVAGDIPVITRTGSGTITQEVNSTYTDAGATASDTEDGDITSSIVSTGSVDTTTVGTYTIKYNVTDSSGNDAVEVTRTVNIVDTTAPVITRTGSGIITQEVDSTYTDAGATCSDNYDAACSTTSTGSVDTSTIGTYTIKYNVTDSSGNDAVEVTRTVNIVDTTSPVITVTGANPASVVKGATYTDAGATCSDNYDATCSTTSTGSVDTSTTGTYTITYSATDSEGNTSTATRTVNVVAGDIPVISRTGSGSVTQEVGGTYTDAGATANDPEDGDISADIVTTNPVDTTTVGTYTIKYNVTDSSGNDAVEVTRTVNIVDTTAPVITRTGSGIITQEVDSTYTDAGATCSDNYDATCSTTSTGSVDTSTTGTYTITYSATDSEGNTSTATRTVNVVAGDIPVITRTGSGTITQEVDSTYTDAGATCSDNYDATCSTTSTGSVDTRIVGTYTIKYNVTDSSGNDAVEVTRTVNIVDTTAPVITRTGSGTITQEVDSTYSDAGATASDTEDGDITSSIVSTGSVDTSTIGTYTIKYNVTDSSGNAAVEVTRTVNIVDTTAPVITVTGNNPETVNKNDTYTDAGATCSDNYDATCSTTSTGSVDTSTTGTYTITYSAIDSEGNTSTATRTVNVVAGDIPVISRTGSGSITQEVGGTYTDAGATASDTEDGDISADIVTTNPVNANVVGTYMVRYNVTDASGNAAFEVTRTVNIVDTTAPTNPTVGSLSPNPAQTGDTVILTLSGIEEGISVTVAGMSCSPTPADASGNVTCTASASSGLLDGSNNTISVTDESGNSNTQVSAPVLTVDDTAPTTPTASTSPSPANNGTSVTTSISGVEEGATVSVAGMTCTPNPADASGNVSCTGVVGSGGLDGSDTIINVTDTAGNTNTGATTGLVVDNTSPAEPTITSVDGKMTAPYEVNDATPDIVMGAENGSTVTITGMTCSPTPVSGGSVTCTPDSLLTEGVHTFIPTITDAAGNSTTGTGFDITIDTIAASSPVINEPTSGVPITGTGEAGSFLEVTTPSGASCSTTVQANGTWSCSISPTPVEGESVSITQTDTAGNTSNATISTINTSTDTDGDGNSDAIEDAGFNNGDGNGDGIQDSQQGAISGAPNPVTGAYTTLEASGACTFISQNSFVAESSLGTLDVTAEYPVGLADFQVRCANPGESANIKLYYDREYDTSAWTYKKYNGNGEVYSDISSGVVFGTQNVGGTIVTTASFTVTDGDINTDEDGVADAVINDPSGPAIAQISGGSGGNSGGVKYDRCYGSDTSGSIYDGKCSSEEDIDFESAPEEDNSQDNAHNTESENVSDSCSVIRDINNTVYSYPSENVFIDENISTEKSLIQKFSKIGIINGYEDGNFRPLQNMTRVEFLKVLLLSHCYDYRGLDTSDMQYTDVVIGSWEAQVIKKAEELGVIDGDVTAENISVFRPNDLISKAEAVKILMQISFVKVENPDDLLYTDIPVAWHRKYVREGQTLGIFNPEEDDFLFHPDAWISRQDVIKLISKQLSSY